MFISSFVFLKLPKRLNWKKIKGYRIFDSSCKKRRKFFFHNLVDKGSYSYRLKEGLAKRDKQFEVRWQVRFYFRWGQSITNKRAHLFLMSIKRKWISLPHETKFLITPIWANEAEGQRGVVVFKIGRNGPETRPSRIKV